MVERVAILGGTGKMGRWFALFFKNKGYDVVIGGRSPERNRTVAQEIGVEAAISNIDAVWGADIVVVSTTLETTVNTILQIRDYVKKGAIVFDIASVKGRIPEALKELSSKGSRVISIHPMFGPGADSFRGRRVIVVPIVEDDSLTNWAVDLFRGEGADVCVVRDGEEHDRLVAITLSLPHFLNIVLGRVLARRDIQKVKRFAGTTFSLQLTLAEAVLSEDPDLYYGIESLNPSFRKLVEELISTAQDTAATLDDRGTFIKSFIEAREALSRDPEFSTAYERFYRAVNALSKAG